MKAKISRFRCVLTALFFVSWCMLPGPALAADKYWVGGDAGYWDDSANWCVSDGGPGGAGQPQDGDNIYLIRSVTGGDATVQYRNSVNPIAQLGALYLYGFGTGLLTLEQSSGDTLKTSSEYIGMNGRGAYNQINGANLVSGELLLGYYSGSQGSYTLQGGSLSARTQTVGFLGSGAFTQTGGTNSVTNSLNLAQNRGSRGTYNLNGGSLSAQNLIVGISGTGNPNRRQPERHHKPDQRRRLHHGRRHPQRRHPD